MAEAILKGTVADEASLVTPIRSPNFKLTRIAIHAVRNIRALSLEPHPRLNLVVGRNGHGKTSLLESIYVVATTKSFRTAKLSEIVKHGEASSAIHATFVETHDSLPDLDRQQTVSIVKGRAHPTIEGNKPARAADYAIRSPVVVFHPDELALSTGPASLRRRLLDRVATYQNANHVAHLGQYLRALKARQEMLRTHAGDSAGLTAYEALCAKHGAHVTRARADAASFLAEDLTVAFRRIADPRLALTVRFAGGGSADEASAVETLSQRRGRDARSKAASFGPHRDELEIALDGSPAREVASQGQHRAIALSLKAAESLAIRRATGLEPIQLLDDVSSELDEERTRALFDFLLESRGQIFLSSAQPEAVRAHLPEDAEKLEIPLENGQIQG